MSGEQTIRVYCPTHKTSFTAKSDATLLCETGGHALSQGFPPEDFWEYCCDCQCFRPSEIRLSGKAQERCMVCERRIARRFLCDGCNVISVESDETAKRRKPYTVSAAGGVEPECPACAKKARASDLYPHDCTEAEARLVTAREICPFCDGQVRPAPPPPPAVAPHSNVAARTSAAAAVSRGALDTLPDTATPVGVCLNCGKEYTSIHTFCGGCGLMLPTHPSYDERAPEPVVPDYPVYQPPPPDPTPKPPPTPPPTPSSRKGAVAALGVVVALLLFITFLAGVSKSGRSTYTNSSNATYGESTESKLSRAISQNNLLTPTGSSAYDYYGQLRREGASTSSLATYNEQLLPLLKERPQQLLASLYDPGGDDGTLPDWEEAARMLEWAAEIAPGDNWVKSRAVYCRGRVAYLTKDGAEAQRLWQQAGDLDKKWPVPVNGIGLVYNDGKDFLKSRPFFLEALRRDPNWAVPYNNLGTSFRELNDTASAYENYNHAVSLAPKWGRPHAWLADMAAKDGNYSRAADEYKAVLDLVPVGTPGWNLDKVRQKYDAARAKAGL
jgi:tetratricopeptide (TPR) repeat protein